ncbi:MAG: hypothetical protein AAF645_13935, partial [Myxococcota bacterium]
FMAGADLVMLHPIGVMAGGERYFEKVASSFPERPLLVSGGISVENAPNFLELGARAAVVDTGVFPDTNDPSAVEVITRRAAALTEICAEVTGATERVSFTELRAVSEFPTPNDDPTAAIADAIEDALVEEMRGSEVEIEVEDMIVDFDS